MYELADHELDAVTGAQGNGNGNAFGLVAVGISAQDLLNGNSVLNGNTVTVTALNNVSVPIGIAASILGISANAVRSTI
jgi:hypothetical protein